MEQSERFEALFQGFDEAFGTGKGQWVDAKPETKHFKAHLEGKGPGLGIGPLRRDGTVSFAAIDLDEPDFAAAEEMQTFIPGISYIEKSRSGNAHVWVFFSKPIEAWIPKGILREATIAVGKSGVEVFPKQGEWHDRLTRGSYINLPFYGDTRPILIEREPITVERFLEIVEFNEPADWRKRADWLMIEPPSEQKSHAEFGEQPQLHMCIEHIIANRDENPVLTGHRSVVYFHVAKGILNTRGFDAEEALYFLRLLNDSSPDKVPDKELRRIVDNAARGRFTSTGCDDPLMAPYVLDDCPIVKGSK